MGARVTPDPGEPRWGRGDFSVGAYSPERGPAPATLRGIAARTVEE